MLIPIKPMSSSKLGHVGLKTRSPGQILEKPCVLSRGHSFDPKFMKLCQDVNSHKSRSSFHVGSKTRSLGQIMKIPYLHSRGHSFDQKFMKLCQNGNPHANISKIT